MKKLLALFALSIAVAIGQAASAANPVTSSMRIVAVEPDTASNRYQFMTKATKITEHKLRQHSAVIGKIT